MDQRELFQSRRAIILLIDDDAGDRELTRRAFQEVDFRVDLRTVNDGQVGLDYLLHRGEYRDPKTSARPDLILLDLNMPGLSGLRVLKKLGEDADLKQIPVVVLTVSNREEDIVRSYDLGCNSFIQKPVEMDQFIRVARELGHYWFELVALPPFTEMVPT